jgi:hypothetical protein
MIADLPWLLTRRRVSAAADGIGGRNVRPIFDLRDALAYDR